MLKLLIIIMLNCMLPHTVQCMEQKPEQPKKLVNQKHQNTLNAALITAAELDNLDLVRLLLEQGADVNAKTSFLGFTALHAAAYKGNIDMINLLLSYKPCLVEHNVKISTPLALAKENKHHQAVTILEQAINNKQ